MKRSKQEVIDQFKLHENDTGSTEVQIALLVLFICGVKKIER
jgi:ribosomal protein S15